MATVAKGRNTDATCSNAAIGTGYAIRGILAAERESFAANATVCKHHGTNNRRQAGNWTTSTANSGRHGATRARRHERDADGRRLGEFKRGTGERYDAYDPARREATRGSAQPERTDWSGNGQFSRQSGRSVETHAGLRHI